MLKGKYRPFSAFKWFTMFKAMDQIVVFDQLLTCVVNFVVKVVL